MDSVLTYTIKPCGKCKIIVKISEEFDLCYPCRDKALEESKYIIKYCYNCGSMEQFKILEIYPPICKECKEYHKRNPPELMKRDRNEWKH